MSKTLKTVSARAIAAATLTAVTLANGSAASAHPLNGAHRLPLFTGPSAEWSPPSTVLQDAPARIIVPRLQPSAAAPDVG